MNCSRLSVFFRSTVCGAIAATLLAGTDLSAAEVATGPIVELPKFIVMDSRELPPPEEWRYGTIPGFEILTNASDRATQRLIRDFEIFRMGLGHVWPMPNRPGYPISLIISGRGGKFDAFVPPGHDREMARASLFLRQGNRSAIVIDFQTSVLNVIPTELDDPASGTDSTRFSVDHYKQLYREYVRYLLSQSEPRLPAWFEEGMSQIIMAMKVDRKFIEFGKLEDPNTVSIEAGLAASANAAAAAEDPDAAMMTGAPVEDRDFNAALQRKALIRLDRFFGVKHGAPETVNPLGNNVWAKQAYAFVHMCLYGEGGKYQKAFTTFLVRAAREPVTEELFKDCFKVTRRGTQQGMTYAEMLNALKGYIDFTVYKSTEFRAPKGSEGIPVPPPLVLRDATQSEVGRIKGEALVLAGQKEKARTELIAPYQRGEREPALLAALGLHERARGEDERARKFLEAATAAKVVRPEAYLELARFRTADAIAQSGDANARLSAAQTLAVIEPLRVARGQPPPLPEVYELMADTLMRSAAAATKEEALILIEGARLFPGRMKLVFQAAQVCAAAGMNDAAHTLADHGIKFAPDSSGKEHFAKLKAALPPVSPATAPAAKK